MRKYKSRCRLCRQPWIPDARHVNTEGRVEDCIMDDNLEYLELKYEKNLKNV